MMLVFYGYFFVQTSSLVQAWTRGKIWSIGGDLLPVRLPSSLRHMVSNADSEQQCHIMEGNGRQEEEKKY